MTTGVPRAQLAAVIAGELASLATDAKLLATRLAPGDLVAAVVLPSNGLTDLLDIGGLRVAAELPPTLLPGQTIAVKVIDFTGERINLHIVDVADETAPARRAPSAHAPAVSPAPARPALPAAGLGPAAPRALPQPAAAVPLGTREPGAATAQSAAAYAALARPAQPVRPAMEAIEARLAASHAAVPTLAPQTPSTPGMMRPLIAMRPTPNAPQPPVTAPAVTPRGPLGFSTPEPLLRALRLPVTATNIALARLALDAPQKLPAALAVLERALSATAAADPRVATLSTLTSFIARLNPLSPVLATQIGAFVDNVVTGSEAKLAGLLLASSAEGESPAVEPQRAAVVRTALDYDLKTQLLAWVADTPAGGEPAAARPPQLQAAVEGALVAITALQLSAASMLGSRPDGLEFNIPVQLPDGQANARVRIGRDASDGGPVKLDGDNFHLTFVLETRRLGIVALELTTVGRAVSLNVKTESPAVRRILTSALPNLSARLELLRYRVVGAQAAVAAGPLGGPVPPPANDPVAAEGGVQRQLVDVDA